MSEKDITATTHFEDKGQMRIAELPGAVPYGESAMPIMAKDVAFIDQARSDESMLREANQNREESESFITTRGLIGRWNLAEIMLRAWVEPIKWKGSDQFRSHLGIPLVAEQFYSIHSVVNQTLFGGYKIFQVDATSSTPLECAEAQQAIVSAELKTCGFKGVSCKTEMRFPPKTKYEDANAEIGRRGWAIMQIPVSAHNCRWGLCCGDCVKTLGG